MLLLWVAERQPQANEIRVRVRAHSVNFGDLMARNFAAVSSRVFHMPFFF